MPERYPAQNGMSGRISVDHKNLERFARPPGVSLFKHGRHADIRHMITDHGAKITDFDGTQFNAAQTAH